MGGQAGAGGTLAPADDQLVDARDGRKYPTKQFGAQVWMTAGAAVAVFSRAEQAPSGAYMHAIRGHVAGGAP
jgi:hypothetical protein